MDIVRKDIELITATSSPDQHSRKHILNALNNDCIQEIFRRLKNIEDFLSAAETCIQFQENARQCFPKTYKVFYSTYGKNNAISNKLLSINRVQSFLSIFGDFIETIAWGNNWEGDFEPMYKIGLRYVRIKRGVKEDREYDNKNLRPIADHCGKTLKELQIMHRLIDLNIMHKFQALEKLEIYRCGSIYVKASNPELFRNLKILKLSHVYGGNVEWLEQAFPKLIEADLNCVKVLNKNTVIEFIKLNPQLQSLHVDGVDLGPSFWHAFDDLSSSELRWMDVRDFCFYGDEQIKRLSKCFSNLNYIHLDMGVAVAKPFINLLAENNVPIEILSMNQYDMDCAENIRKLKHIKAINIYSPIQGDLKKLCKSLPTLKGLKIHMGRLNEMEIIDALKYGKNLSMLSIGICEHLTINSNFIKNLLNINKNRVKLALFSHKLTLLVDNSILNHNENWLKIRQGFSSQIAMDGLSELAELKNRTLCQLGRNYY